VDRAPLSEAIVEELGTLFVSELQRVGPELVAADLDGIERHLQEVSRRVLGRVVEAVVTAIAAGQAGERPTCGTCDRPMRAVDPARPRALQGLVGDYQVHRAYYVCDRCGHGVAPLDERLGLGAGALSPGLARVACRVGIEAGFGTAADLLEETLRVDVATEAVRRVTEGIGAVAEAEEQAWVAQAQAGQAPPPDGGETPPAALVVEVDGVQVHAGGDWPEVKVGLVAPLGPATWTVAATGRVALTLGRQSACAGFETAALFWYRVYVAACLRGLHTPELALVVVLGDGADWIWRYAWQFLGRREVEVIEIVDIFHAWDTSGRLPTPPSGPAPLRLLPGPSRSRAACSTRDQPRSSPHSLSSPRSSAAPTLPRKSARRAAISPTMPTAWTTPASSPASCRSARVVSRAPARP